MGIVCNCLVGEGGGGGREGFGGGGTSATAASSESNLWNPGTTAEAESKNASA